MPRARVCRRRSAFGWGRDPRRFGRLARGQKDGGDRAGPGGRPDGKVARRPGQDRFPGRRGEEMPRPFLGGDPFKGERVLVKPNFNSADDTPGSTHNDTLNALLARIRDGGAKTLSIGDRSGPEPTLQVFEKKGIPALAASFDAKVLNFDALGETGYVAFDPPALALKSGFLVARPVVETECVVSTCCLKTHRYGGHFTLSLKNSVGIVPRAGHNYMRQLHGSADQRRMIAEINTAYKPAVIVVDGLVAFVDEGPMTGSAQGCRRLPGRHRPHRRRRRRRRHPQGAWLERRHHEAAIFAQEQISWAVQLGLGISSAADIVIATPDAASEAYAEKIRKILAAGLSPFPGRAQNRNPARKPQ